MQLTFPIALIALGGLLLITQRNRWLVLGALFVQWIGFAWHISTLPSGFSIVQIEIVTAVACCGIFALTLVSLSRTKDRSPSSAARFSPNPRSAIVDQFWLWAIAIVAGLAGYGLARLYPLGGSEQDLVAFYWILLPAILAIVIDGSREPVKMSAGLIALFNAALLLLYSLSATSPGVVVLGLASVCRLALAALLSYTWLFLKTSYLSLDLNTLFDMRDSKVATTTALALVPSPAEQIAAEPHIEVIEPEIMAEDATAPDDTTDTDEANDDA